MWIKNVIITIISSARFKPVMIVILGIICGSVLYISYESRIWSYLSDSPETCVNCHVMRSYYTTWSHSSHGHNTVCNDCHVPNNNPVTKLLFEGMDGVKHTAAFTFLNESQVITAGSMSSSVIMNNCIRCHTQLNTEIVNTGRITRAMAAKGEGKLCWDCHRDVPHGRNSLSSTENAPVPFSGI